jgi:hypothetical protein
MDACLEDPYGKVVAPVKHSIPKSKLTGSILLQTAVGEGLPPRGSKIDTLILVRVLKQSAKRKFVVWKWGRRVFQKPPRLLKKSQSDWLVVPKRARTPPKRGQNIRKTGFFASEQDSEEGTKGFFNTLERF